MKLTANLKKWLVEQKGLPADSTDDTFRRAAADALLDGTLAHEEFVSLTADADAGPATDLQRQINVMASAITKLTDSVGRMTAPAAPPAAPKITAPPLGALGKAFAEADKPEEDSGGEVNLLPLEKMFATNRTAAFFPQTTSKGVRHPYAGQPVFDGGRDGKRSIDHGSDLDMATIGAVFKWQISTSMGRAAVPRQCQMTELDKRLIESALRQSRWVGVLHGEGTEDDGAIGLRGQMLTPSMQKALIDDSTSGGLEAVPIEFDDAVILTPLLYAEFYPKVEVVNVTRGRRIEGVVAGNVTLSSGGVDATAIPLFNTASFVSAFDTTIHVANGCIEIGLDFISDSPLDWGRIVSQQYGEQLQAWLDTQICVGDGTTEPEGVITASGTTSVTASNAGTGPPILGDYEGLLFGVAKPYKRGYPADRCCFGGTETSYSRARGMAVGTTDARRLFGSENYDEYRIMGHPYGINESLTNRQIFYANLGRYRMYRRLGLTVKATTEGRTLVRANSLLISARARFGGQLTDPLAAAVVTNGMT